MVDGASPVSRRTSPSLLQRSDVLGAVARFWVQTWAPDYVALGLLLAGELLIQLLVEPFHRLFYLSNPAIQFPHAQVERVPPQLLLVYAAGVPLAALTVWALLCRPNANLTHATFLGLSLSLFLTGFVTDVIKNAVGRPRPDLLSRCGAAPGTPPDALVGVEVCTTTAHHLLHDGWRSFPSGHSSFSFAGLGYLTLFLVAHLRATHHATPLPISLLCLSPALGALLIAISRTEDYRHDVWDVTAGSILGILGSYIGWRRYFVAVGVAVPHAKTLQTAKDGTNYRRQAVDSEQSIDLEMSLGPEERQRMLDARSAPGTS